MHLLFPLFFSYFNNVQTKVGCSIGSLNINIQKKVNSSNRNGKWNVMNMSNGKHLFYVEEGFWRQKIYAHIYKPEK